ncbi:cobyrinate a,c-diamide synthase [Treponema ruminis]|uniref:Cobyrinate a,c-diamide synthase n=1 Tax=Treponema ruminis TaxID=744515 RepID=A0A7W8GB46_9SPIR|nr:cobyrinate a,c-diamide synthase [Treponema ruminis]MBB5227156.1 cobyrinic acid a,c-diamide synthase [Treponema ruminis]
MSESCGVKKSQIFNAPRIMIAAPKSGSGKTSITCALLQLLKNHGKNPVAFKCGPDYIDPMFHRQVLGINSTNLDSFFCDDRLLKEIFRQNTGSQENFAVIEGVMGLFDGLGGTSVKASSYDIARITRTPIILLIDAEGASRSILPLIKGFLDYDSENLIKGIFLNKVSKSTYLVVKPLIEEELKIPLIGFFPKDSENVLKSRHLGLVLPNEIKDLKEQIQKSAEVLESGLDFKMLENISRGDVLELKRRPLTYMNVGILKDGNGGENDRQSDISDDNSYDRIKIAVAFDEAFCFYYQENLKLLESYGAKIEYFSPLHDKSLPDGAKGILLGGGYPELYAEELEANLSMRNSINGVVQKGIPLIAECGGFMYLQEKLTAQNGKSYQMCGAIKGECRYTGKLVRFGYAEFSLKEENSGDSSVIIKKPVRGHEFHYFDSTNNGACFTAEKPLSKKSWDCMIFNSKMLAGFPHLYYPSNPEIVRWFIDECKKGWKGRAKK